MYSVNKFQVTTIIFNGKVTKINIKNIKSRYYMCKRSRFPQFFTVIEKITKKIKKLTIPIHGLDNFCNQKAMTILIETRFLVENVFT